jgi:hypothetical protein
VLGTLVGNLKSDIVRYGNVLRPQIFTDNNSSVAKVDDIVCKPNEYFNLASAYQLAFGSGTKFDIDKEGHAFVHLSASSTVHPLGAGRSLEMATDGSIKLSVGKTNVDQKSINLDTSGTVNMHFGSDSVSLTSCSWILDRKLNIVVNGASQDGLAKNEEYFGNVFETIHGDKTISVDGSLNIIVGGKHQENILGSKVENYVNDKMTNYGGDYQEIVTGQLQTKLGEGSVTDISTKGDKLTIVEGDKTEDLLLGNKTVTLTAGDSKETLLLGNHKVDMTAGDMTETLLKGNRKTTITLGNHEIDVSSGDIKESVSLGNNTETIDSGDKSITVTIGNFKVNVTTGNITIETTTGTVSVKSDTQTVTVNGMLGVDVTSGTQVNVKAPLVNLGQSPVKGGVVTGLPMPSCYDSLTGLPLIGSTTVTSAI